MLYQLSHFRSIFDHRDGGAESQNRTGDTAIFSRVLYQLSYLGPMANQALAARRLPNDTTRLRAPSRRRGGVRSTVSAVFVGENWQGDPKLETPAEESVRP
jgi:hypothetical protein